jgi:hypothetical protein
MQANFLLYASEEQDSLAYPRRLNKFSGGKGFCGKKCLDVNRRTVSVPETHVIMSSTSTSAPSETYDLGTSTPTTHHGLPLGVRFDDKLVRYRNNHPFPKAKLGVVLGIIAVITIVFASTIAFWCV